jgi:hypothetical protein
VNRIVRNRVSGTRAALACEAARTRPECAAPLSVCGVGIWIAGGGGNRVARNVLTDNDVSMRDDTRATPRDDTPPGRASCCHAGRGGMYLRR